MKNYSIGLDIGTNSVGWAVIDSDTYKIIKKGNKSLWGSRLFEEATTAEVRRNFRSQRRRYDRRRERVNYLNDIFKSEIEKVDKDFYQKLQESFLYEEDKNIKEPFSKKELQEYNKNFPTIYHLRNYLVNSKQKEDIRLIYLAIHHIIKYRGNFLYNADAFSVNDFSIANKIKMILEMAQSINEQLEFNSDDIDYSKLEEIILSKNYKKDKEKLLNEELKISLSKNFYANFSKLIIGFKANLSKMFGIDSNNVLKLSFKDDVYEEKIDSITDEIGNNIEILNEIKELYDMIFLKELFQGKEYTNISLLMIDKYNKHKTDLKKLKRIIKLDKSLYNKMFIEKPCEYTKFIKNNINYDDFRKIVIKYLEKIKSKLKDNIILYQEDIATIIKELEEDEFLPKITSVDKGKYPYQLNKQELIGIIEKQALYYPFLQEKLKDGTYKIVKLLTFRIPYYVGPLNEKSDKAWLSRTKEKITPFNFNEVVNTLDSAEKFITRMTSKCTYLLDEDVIPAKSILYSEFKVLNELKQIAVNNQKLTLDLQHKIYEEYFKIHKNVKDKEFVKYLNQLDEYKVFNGNLKVTGYSQDGGFANDMVSYIDFFGEDGLLINTNLNIEDAENFIKWVTIFEDKNILERKIKENYPQLSKDIVKKIVNKNYSGWSRLSEKLLTYKWYQNKENNTKLSVIDLLRDTNSNFMQIINDDKYNFQKFIKDENNYVEKDKLSYSLIEDLVTSPSTKKGIYQSLKVVDDIVKYMKKEPLNISIEMARNEEKKVRKDSKQKYLEKLYQSCKEEINNYKKLSTELKNYDNYKKINTQKLFLYFIQEGKCLYCQKSLQIEDFEKYQIDHIIPRTLIKDDSVSNKALVHSLCNQEKRDGLILPRNFRSDENIAWWGRLKKMKLMDSKKYKNLTRKEYKEEDIKNFINRQLVETRQITKHVANIINEIYKNTKVIYLHENLSHNYREKEELFKFRDLNDYHHAHDAYLAAVLGEYTNNYKRSIDYDTIKEKMNEYYENKDYKKMGYGYIINSTDENIYDKEGEALFDSKQFNDIVTNTLYRNDILISKKTEIKTGEFYNQTIYPKNKKTRFPLKRGLDNNKYGGYNSLNPSYAIVIKYTKKNKEKQRLIGIPIIIDVQTKKDKNIKIEYIKNLLNLQEDDTCEIIKDKIPFNITLNWDGKICSLVGATDTVEVCNALEFQINKDNLIKWKHTLNKLLNNKRLPKDFSNILYDNQLSEIIDYIINKMITIYNLYSDLAIKLKLYLETRTLETKDKEQLIKELLNLLKYNSKTANLKFLDEKLSGEFGRTKNKNIESSKVLNKSTTGIRVIEREF